ncbi:hypothetical protein CRX72_16225 [Pantoea sp. BRM17]|nr:hypothetical protein CRX72_16225 [Pantoea sp. BRM17]
MWSAISRLLSEQTQPAEITQREPLPGGDIHPAWRIRYGDMDVFVKCNTHDRLDLFRWLGTNSFGIVSTLTPEAVSEQAARIAEVALHQSPQTKVTTLQQFLQNPV